MCRDGRRTIPVQRRAESIAHCRMQCEFVNLGALSNPPRRCVSVRFAGSVMCVLMVDVCQVVRRCSGVCRFDSQNSQSHTSLSVHSAQGDVCQDATSEMCVMIGEQCDVRHRSTPSMHLPPCEGDRRWCASPSALTERPSSRGATIDCQRGESRASQYDGEQCRSDTENEV